MSDIQDASLLQTNIWTGSLGSVHWFWSKASNAKLFEDDGEVMMCPRQLCNAGLHFVLYLGS